MIEEIIGEAPSWIYWMVYLVAFGFPSAVMIYLIYLARKVSKHLT